MIELLLTIATLCQIQPARGGDVFGRDSLSDVDKYQLACQQYYTECVNTRAALTSKYEPLGHCTMERRIK